MGELPGKSPTQAGLSEAVVVCTGEPLRLGESVKSVTGANPSNPMCQDSAHISWKGSTCLEQICHHACNQSEMSLKKYKRPCTIHCGVVLRG